MTKTVTHKDNLPYFGSEALLEIATNRKFSDMIYELLSGESPNVSQSKIFETILNISIDHGEDTPSAVEVIKSAKEGKTISESVALGILQINNSHGGAIEPAMELLYKLKNEKTNIKEFIANEISAGNRLPGFGHRIYEVDPRSELLFRLSQEEKIDQSFIEIAKEVEKELKDQKGKALPINIDGSIAAIMCAFGWDPKLGKAIFISARTPGLLGQYLKA